jgi:hypothetical protein
MFHKLTDKEMHLTVELILAYLEYLEVYKSKEAAVKLYLERESRIKICTYLEIKDQQIFSNYLTVLKKKKVLEPTMAINPVLIPNMEDVSIAVNMKYE